MMHKDTVPCSAHVASTVKNSQVLWKGNFKSAKMEVKTAFSLSTKFKFERTLQRHCFLIYSTDFVRLIVSSYFTWVHPSCKVQQGFKHICFYYLQETHFFFPFLIFLQKCSMLTLLKLISIFTVRSNKIFSEANKLLPH